MVNLKRETRERLLDSIDALYNALKEIGDDPDALELIKARSKAIRALYWIERALAEDRLQEAEGRSEKRGRSSGGRR
ncbi:MAG: hypothetical protein QXP84_08115 [Candidatus Korarchaeum sp.]